MKTSCFVLLILVLTMTTTTMAQEKDADVTEYKFDDDVVTGDLIRPDGSIVTSRHADPNRSLVKVRKHFVPEMFKSVENI